MAQARAPYRFRGFAGSVGKKEEGGPPAGIALSVSLTFALQILHKDGLSCRLFQDSDLGLETISCNGGERETMNKMPVKGFKLPRAMGFFLILTAFLCVFRVPVLASPSGGTADLKSASADPLPLHETILKGIHLIYNREFTEAEAVFRQVVSGAPEDPAGYFYLSMVSWSRLTAGFWSPSDVQEYKERIDRTIEIAEKSIAASSGKSFDFFFLGGALGFKGRFEMMKGNWLSSFFLARDAINALQTCQKLDPQNKDVLLGLGTFDYYTATLRGVLRFLTFFLLHKGDAQEGLRKLHMAANEALYSATEAKSMLLHIYLFMEQDFEQALEIAQDLSMRYQKNPRFLVLEGLSHIRLTQMPEYRSVVQRILQRADSEESPVRSRMWKNQALYLQSMEELFFGNLVQARILLWKILDDQDPENDPDMVAWPLVKLGMSYDLEDKRDMAVKFYQQVVEMENGAGAQFLAKKLLNNPAVANDPFLGY